jgi:hypothetical protein
MKLKEYIFSCHVRHEGHFTKPIPHPIWWRRLLGQTVSSPIGWEYISRVVEIPEGLVYEDWVQKLLIQLPIESINHMLEQQENTRYVVTKGIELTRTNHLLNTDK